MSSNTLPPIDYSGPLSQRAVQMLRELRGLSLLDKSVPMLTDVVVDSKASSQQNDRRTASNAQVEPTLSSENLPDSSKLRAKNSNKLFGYSGKDKFSREAYLRETRENLLGEMVVNLFIFCAIIFGLAFLTESVVMPKRAELQQNLRTMSNLPIEIQSTSAKLDLQKKKYEKVSQENERLSEYFNDEQEVNDSYMEFLNSLDSKKVGIVNQASAITQTTVNPLYVDFLSANDAKKALTQNVKPDAKLESKPNAKQEVKADVKIDSKSTFKISQRSTPVNSNQEAKPGLNYRHYEVHLQGGYVGYLFARQALINVNSNLIVHSESISASTTAIGQMDIVVFFSLPFLKQP
jgi:hypothetical protein